MTGDEQERLANKSCPARPAKKQRDRNSVRRNPFQLCQMEAEKRTGFLGQFAVPGCFHEEQKHDPHRFY